MGEARPSLPVKLICGVLAGRGEWLDAACPLLERELGPIDLSSETWPFDFTDYYEKEMGPGLLRRFYSFRELMNPEHLVDVKHATNRLEKVLSGKLSGGPPRPVNLDPGYVCGSKLVLASTKDYSHRIYLRAGIFAEVTLRWRSGKFEPLEWTYPDYRTERYLECFSRVRGIYMEQLREKGLA